MIIAEKQHVLQLFGVLHDTGKLSSIEKLNIAFSDEQIAIISNCNWSGAKHWVEWWTRESHLNSLAKDGDNRKDLYFVLCSLR